MIQTRRLGHSTAQSGHPLGNASSSLGRRYSSTNCATPSPWSSSASWPCASASNSRRNWLPCRLGVTGEFDARGLPSANQGRHQALQHLLAAQMKSPPKVPRVFPHDCQARSRSRHTRQAVGQPARRADNPASCRRQRAGTASVRSMTLATGRGHKSCTPSGSPQTSSLNGTSGRTVRGQVERRPRPWISCRHASRRLQAGHRSGGGSSSLSVADPSGRYRHTHEPRAP